MKMRIFAVLLTLAMLLGMLPMAVFAEETNADVYLAAYASTVTVDGTLEALWSTEGRLSDGTRFGVMWNDGAVYVALAKTGALTLKLGEQTLSVAADGTVSGIDGAVAAVGAAAVEVKIPYSVSSYDDTAALSIVHGAAVWEGTLGFSSLVREIAPLSYMWELGKAYSTVATDSVNLGGEKVTGGFRMWNRYDASGMNSAQGRVYSGTGNTPVAFLAGRQTTLTLEYDFRVDAMPAYEEWNYTRGYCCYGFAMAMTSDTKEGYMAGITNSPEGLRFCVMTAEGDTSVLLGKNLGETFHIRQDWTMDGDLELYVDGDLLHTFKNTEATAETIGAHGWPNANVLIFNLWSDNRILTSHADDIDFTYSNLRMGKVPMDSPLDGLDFAAIKGKNTDAASVSADLVLPGAWSNGQLAKQEITWSSSAPDVISAAGKVTPAASDTQVTLTASLKNDPTVTKSITVTVGRKALQSVFTEATITLDGVRGAAELWPANMEVGTASGSAPYAGVASLWHQEKAYFFINYIRTPKTVTLLVDDQQWIVDLSQSQVSDGALTGVVTANTVELCLDLKAAGLKLMDYGVDYDFQVTLSGDNGTAKLAENPLILRFAIQGEKSTQINSSTISSGLVSSGFSYRTLPIRYSGTGVIGRDYLFTTALADMDHRKDLRLDQTLTIHSMPVSTGAVTNRLKIEGYCINFSANTNDGRKDQDIVTASIYNSATDGLVLRVLQGGAYYPVVQHSFAGYTDVKLGKRVGDTFQLSLRWNADNSLVVTVDGIEKGTVEKVTIWSGSIGSQNVVLNYYAESAAATDTHSMTIADVAFVQCMRTPDSIKEEVTKELLLKDVDLTAVSEDLPLAASYTSQFLGQLPLTWVSDHEEIIAPDGTVTRPAGTVGKYVALSAYIGQQKLFTVYPYVLPETILIPASPEILGAAFSAAAVAVDGAATDEGWSMNTKLLTASGQQLGRLGAQWSAEKLYLAIETGGLTPTVKLGNQIVDLTGAVIAGNVLEIAVPLSSLGITADDYGKTIAAEVTMGDASWKGTIVLTSNDWFGTGSTAPVPPSPLSGSAMIQGVGADQPTANQGVKNLGDGWQFFDTYDPEGNNVKQVRSYVIYMPLNAAGEAYYAPFVDRTVASYVEFDFCAKSMPEYTLGEATGWDNRWACYGFSWLLTGNQVDNYADTVAVGIYNSDKGLVFTALSNKTQTVLLNRQVGDLFRIGVRWNPDDSITVFLDGEKFAEFENMTVTRRAMGDTAVNLNLIRGAKAAESFNDNFDISVTNLAFGKSYGDKLIDTLTFDVIRGENTDPYAITSQLTLPQTLSNAQLDPNISLTWVSTDPAVIAADGTVTQPENGKLVTLTATAANGDSISFELYVVGTQLPEDVLYVHGDTDTANGAGVQADFYRFTLDATNNSVIRDLKESKTVNVIALHDSDGVSRLNESVLTIWVSDDNVTYTRINNFKLLRSGEYVYLYDFEATGRYIKVHCTHYDGTEADFTAPLQDMIDAYYEDVFGAGGGTFTEGSVTVTNPESVTVYDKVWQLEGEYQRVFLSGSLLYHYTDGGKTYVRIPTLEANETVTLTVLSGNADAMNTENKEYTLEVVYGTREVVDVEGYARWIVGMPDGKLLNVMSVDEDADGYSNNYIGFNWSYDGGLTWTEPEKTGFGYEHCVTVAGVMYDPEVGEQGRIIVQGFSWPTFSASDGSQSDCKTRFLLSDDLGETWYTTENEMTILGDPTCYYLSYTAPYKVSTADGEGEGVDYVIPMGCQPSTDSAGSFVGRIAYTCDGGLSWTMGEDELSYTGEGWYAYEVGVSEGTIIETDDGKLVYYGRCQFESMNYFAMAVSEDFGKTWSNATESSVYTVNTQPMFHQLGSTKLLTWAGNTALGGNSYKRYPLNVAHTTDGGMTFENIQNLWSRYSFQGLTEGDNLDVTNQSVASVGDTLMITWSRYLMKAESFTDYFFRTKGAYDSFESATAKYEGWSTIQGTVETSSEQHTEGSYSMKIVDGASAVRSIPYLQDGRIAFDLYLDNVNGQLQIELESAYSDVFGKAAPIALEISDGKLCGLTLKQGWNEVIFDLALTEGKADITVNGESAELEPDLTIGDYICYVEIGYGDTVAYVDAFLAEDNDPQTIPEKPNAAALVEAMINAIGEVTLEDEAQIKAARAAYEALTDAQKALVTNYETLVAAEEALKKLQNLPGFGINLVLNETIDMNLIPAGGVALEGNVISLTYADGSTAQYTIAAVNGSPAVRHSFNADQMSQTVTIQILNAQGEPLTKKLTVSVRDYVGKLLSVTRNDTEKALMIRLLDYGALAQIYGARAAGETVQAADLANSIVDSDLRAFMNSYNMGTPETYDPALTPTGGTFSANLTLNESVDMNVYVDPGKMHENEKIVVKLGDQVLTEGQYKQSVTADGKIAIRYSFNADRMNEELTVALADETSGDVRISLTMSVRKLAYVSMANYSSDTVLCATFAALLDYGALAQQYAGTNTDDLANRYVTADQRRMLTDYPWPET